MDSYSAGGLGASVTLILWILHTIYTQVNHRRIRSNCCGRILSASVDIDPTDVPVRITPKIEVPLDNKDIK